ncbi:MAG: CRISPR-associated endonuclease Cas3'', partial [Isosphaeraceae bacterium]
MPFHAHSGRDRSDSRSDWQPLHEHLLNVAEGARRRGESTTIEGRSLSPIAEVAGLFHDLGKYRPGFQCHIEGLPVPDRESTYHKQAGAAFAWDRRQIAAAFAIAGHHGGLPSLDTLKQAVGGSCGREAVAQLWPDAVADLPALAATVWSPTQVRDRLSFDLETRLVFSCLVDADWSDTAEHDRRVKDWPVEPTPPQLTKELAGEWLGRVRDFIGRKAASCSRAEIRQARDDVLHSALQAADLPPGFFKLEVPTGGGKTLSGLAFALKHAAEKGLRRIIYVAPYLSIIDQNAGVIRDALGLGGEALEVFEHHSLTDPTTDARGDPAAAEGADQLEERRAAASRRAENWDAPVVVTTNVQFFESLFSNEPGRCRKLHNIARSIVLLDECQAIPKGLMAPTCSMLRQLVDHLGCSVVLATATQPVFDHPALRAQKCELGSVRPIVSPARSSGAGLFDRLRRVTVQWPRPGESHDWDELAAMMVKPRNGMPPAALAIVNARRAARELYQALEKQAELGECFHLSTWMCPAHRTQVLETVRQRLGNGQPCYVVSTQLIEAGVDVDFPVVLREVAPLEAVIQAAGRCNREAKLNGPDGSPGGLVIVFRSRAAKDEPKRYFPRDPWYRAGLDTLEAHFLGSGWEFSIDDPRVIDEYFTRLLHAGDL